MKKSTYIFISLLLSVNCWNISFLYNILKDDGFLVLTLLWVFSSFYFFNGKKKALSLYTFRYRKYQYGIFIGIFISTFSAFFYWQQSIITTLIAQRAIYEFVLLSALLYVEPTDKDIIKPLKWISIGTIITWAISVFAPQYIYTTETSFLEMEKGEFSRLGLYINGSHLVVVYLYFLIQEYIESFSLKKFSYALLLVLFFVLYGNRSLIIGIFLILMYSITKIKSSHKTLIIAFISLILIAGIFYSASYWITTIERSQSDLTDSDYNRWKALDYYLFEYSPNLFCYIFGNGMPSGGNSTFGNLMWDNMENGIYSSDLGMIGMWSSYGIIPLLIIYSIVITVLYKSHFPLMLKFICFHILLVPTIFDFQGHPGIALFCLIIYLYAYYNEYNKNNHVGYHNSELQK